MLRGYNPTLQALFGSLFTWGLTALGSACVYCINSENKQLLDVSLGFAAGVMTAASFWSLLAPAIEICERDFHAWAFLPVSIGFLVGAAFVYFADQVLPSLGVTDASIMSMIRTQSELGTISARNQPIPPPGNNPSPSSPQTNPKDTYPDDCERDCTLRQRTVNETDSLRDQKTARSDENVGNNAAEEHHVALSWKRIFLLIVAITVHNIPEGLAVGVGFGAVGKSPSATFESAWSLALGIGIQNFPEGLAVSLPLAGFGYTKTRSFFFGQLSGMVEPIAAVIGAALVSVMEPILPYALAFAAGAMIFVVFDDIIPESQEHGNGRLASWGGIVGFIVMMALDVGLG